MTFSIKNIACSLSDYLSPLMPGVEFFEDPNQQGTSKKAAFIQLMAGEVKLKRQKWLQRTLRCDLTYLEDYNLPDLQQRYQAVAELLDMNMETFPYSDGTDSAVLRTYNRQYTIDLDALHYKFDLIVWLSPEDDAVLMQSLTLITEVTYYGYEK